MGASSALGLWAFAWASAASLPLLVRHDALRRIVLWLLPVCGLTLLATVWPLAPGLRLAASSLFFLYLMKGSVLLSYPASVVASWSKTGLLLFMTLWPGMDPARLAARGKPSETAGPLFVRGLLFVYLGIALGLTLTLAYPLVPVELAGWLGVAALLLTIHFGVAEILTGLLRLGGWEVNPLFDRPLAGRSLREFWTERWNLAFVEMDRRLFLRPLARRFGLRGAVVGVFLVSGLLHEMALSYPAGGGWGGPMLYFALQGGLVLLEKRWGIRSRIWTAFWVLALLPLLFHAPFRHTFVLPLFDLLHRTLTARPLTWYFGVGLWVMGGAQLLVLLASFQVPSRLRWREELPRLSPFNQKLMWTYGLFTVLTIVAFGVLTLAFHGSFLRGEPAALGFAGFIAVFWALRVVVDGFYFTHEDWPPGPQFVIGHALLTSLFAFLTLTYGALVSWHLLR